MSQLFCYSFANLIIKFEVTCLNWRMTNLEFAFVFFAPVIRLINSIAGIAYTNCNDFTSSIVCYKH